MGLIILAAEVIVHIAVVAQGESSGDQGGDGGLVSLVTDFIFIFHGGMFLSVVYFRAHILLHQLSKHSWNCTAGTWCSL